MRLPPPPTQAPRKAFSLIEMLVVISIIALLTGISFPVVRSLLRNTGVNTAESQVNNALTAARVFATRSNSFVSARAVGGTLRTSQDNGDGFSGAIVLFAPDNTLRVCENDENAFDPNQGPGWLEFFSIPRRNGYTPVPDVEDQRLTGRVTPLGIVRTGDGPYEIQLIPPPFAMRMSNDGVIAQGDSLNDSTVPWDRVVYVSATGQQQDVPLGGLTIETTAYDIGDDRDGFSGPYDITEFGPDGNLLMPDGRTQLPFGVVETVSGVLVVDTEQVPAMFEHPDGSGSTDTDFARNRTDIYDEDQSAAILNWAADNGTFARIMLFNRYTGQDLTR